MKKLFLLFALSLVSLLTTTAKENPLITFGPMFHLNLPMASQPIMFSWGFEAGIWWEGQSDSSPIGIDFGFDFEENKKRLYVELQRHLPIDIVELVTGASLGPCIQFESGRPVRLGVQSSLWRGYYFCGDVRLRYVYGEMFTAAPGLFYKMGLINYWYPMFYGTLSAH